VTATLGTVTQMGWADGAFLSLSQFFTLSGFLITAILLDGRRTSGTVDLKSFWIRRFRRLAPAAFLGLAGVALFGATVATRTQAERLPGEMLGVVTYVVNWVFVSTEQSYTDLFASPSPVQHYWSLAVEEQFYLIIPIAMFLFFRSGARARTIGIVIGLVALVSTLWMLHLFESGTDLDRIYYGTDTRLAEMLIGALLAVILDTVGHEAVMRRRREFAVAGALSFVVLAWMWIELSLTDDFTWQGAFQLNAVLTCVLILSVIAAAGPVARLYSLRPLVELGKLSYGVYIFHFPLFLWLTEERTGLDQWPLFALRVSISVALAFVSNRFIELPIRHGAKLGLPPLARVVSYPAIGGALVVVALLTANTSGDDPLATLRTDGDQAVAVAADDGVLDILVISESVSGAVEVEFEQLVESAAQVEFTHVDAACLGLVRRDAGPICASWEADWAAAIARHDPDAVVFFVDDWVGDPLADLAAESGENLDDTAMATELLSNGFDVLTAADAPVVFASSAATFQQVFARSVTPFQRAMALLAPARDDVFAVLSGAMPDPAVVPEEEIAAASAQVLLDGAALYQRADRGDDTRVLIVGDSQARSLGYGLERWGPDNGAWVWNVAVNGCGLADEGMTFGSGEPAPVREECARVLSDLERQIASFEPDLVVVFSSTWDLGRRQLDDWDGPSDVGDPRFREYLLREYEAAVDVLSAGGAGIVWMLPPCVDLPDTALPAVDGLDADAARLTLNEVIIPTLVAGAEADGTEIAVFDLDAVLCPGGEPLREADGVRPIRGDGVHFNVEGSAWFADKYGDEIVELGATTQ